MYFRLNPESLLTVGENGSTICDVFTNKIYHLNKYETDLIVHAENNNSVDNQENLYFILEKECLGKFYEKIHYILKVRNRSYLQENIDFTFKRVYLELTNICNYDCDYCASKNYNRSLGCMGCNSFNENGDYLSDEEFIKIIDVISKLGCDELYLTGGDLNLNIDLLELIINHAKEKIKDIFIIQSYKHDYNNFLSLLDDNVHMILQIDLDKFNPDLISDNIIYIVLTPENKKNLFYNKIARLQDKKILPDFLTKGDEINSNLNKNYHFDFDSFFHNLEFHPCLGKSLFISSKGNIYPCPMFRIYKLANTKNKDFLTVLKEIKFDIVSIWKNNLDYIDRCKNCEFRYLCSDCRALEEKLSKSSNNKLLCEFNK